MVNIIRICLHCDAQLSRELLSGTPHNGIYGWVDVLSGDEGGTYDYCPVNPSHEHQAAAR
ncbi:hypothetical protein ABZS29_29240 [Kribbella sp. NPDC005582]|uniref:hypothetical protein n=1 Tax=Kribbella sp. NPDC005582 TaxID=3156893 RepID=UPI0033B6B737